jgi:two-component system, OmpR family, phosphate regulon sensor histidine kinase PhoR
VGTDFAPDASNELDAWRGLALSLFQSLSESHAGRAAEAERHVAEQATQRASFERQIVQDREDFLGLVAHELKTPVAVIKAYAELLEAQMAKQQPSEPNRAAIREVVSHILDQAELMSGLIEEILDIQRVQLGKLPLEVSRLDLPQLARSAAEEVAQATHARMIRVDVADAIPPVQVDRRRIRQVLVNLLENAVKYSDDGDIQVRLGRGEHRGRPVALLSVRDEGIGVEAGDLDRIFDRFVQTSGAPVRGHAGLGLGLYVARQIALAHGGNVWAESAGKGRGSTFHLRLPLDSSLSTD